MKVSQIRELLENYAKITKYSTRPEKSIAIDKFSKILALVDKKPVASVLKRLVEARAQRR